MHGLLRAELEATMKYIAIFLTTKQKQPYYRTRGYINIRVAIILVHATHCYIQGYRLFTINISAQQTQWEEGTRIHLFW